jgi:uncharacterized protein (DUF2141 family)
MKTLILLASLISFGVQAETVTLKLTNLGGEKGQIAVAAFDNADSFPDRSNQAVLTKFFPLVTSLSETTLTLELKPGRYALALFLDANKNQKLDKNIVGAPKERFGFSNNPKITFGAPNFNECEIEVLPGKKQVLSIRMINFF